jgi:type II secretory pathway pseudopilin PulG
MKPSAKFTQLPARRRPGAFSLIELLVVMTLLSLIVVALMQVFSSTQRAFRASATQSDVLEGSRAAMELITADLRVMTPSGGNSNGYLGTVNFSTEGNYSYNTTFQPLNMPLPGGSLPRSNVLNAIFFISRQNQSWVGTGYFVDHTSTKFLYPLYRFTASTSIQNDPFTLRTNFYHSVENNLTSTVWTNMSHIMDGVVHLAARAYDPQGIWINYGYTNTVNVNISPAYSEAQVYFFSNTIPASVELQLGVLEDRAAARAQSLGIPGQAPSTVPVQWAFLQNQSGSVHIFRETVNIENVDRTAYQ